jgi:hypothetical protein
MFCSFKVELKNPANSSPVDDLAPGKSSKFRSEWEQRVESASSQWLKDRPHAPIPRNVGGTPKKKWTPFEDQILETAVAQFGLDAWRRVAMLVPERSSKQCRERWLGHMAPDNRKEEWSAQEDMVLVEKQAQMGNMWAQIKAFLPGRSLVSVKNRWNWLCRRDIPNHPKEFEEIVRSHARPEFNSPEADFAQESHTDIWADDWSLGAIF